MVLATQNPIEQEGTYPLPEAQMDRFLMHVTMSYPDTAAEIDIIRLVRGEEKTHGTDKPSEPIPQQAIFDARAEIQEVFLSEAIEQYIVALVEATRYPEKFSDEIRGWIQIGASPRGSIALDRCSRAHAWLAGRDHVTPDDVRAIVHDCLRHRIMLSFEASAERITADQVVSEIVKQVAVA